MAFLTPDKIRTEKVGKSSITIKEKITPDGARATRDICSYVKKGQLVKPNAKLNNGTGRPKGITVHNTGMIQCASGTTPAEQYARATYPNGNMNGVAVHYWVCGTDIWQQLSDNERGWHAADGSSRRKDHRGGQTGGNLDTISIECIGKGKDSEDTLVKLVTHLCQKHGLDPAFDVYTHNYWMHSTDSIVPGARKNCPIYILPHWKEFLNQVKAYHNSKPSTPDAKPSSLYRVQTGAFKVKSNATKLEAELKKKGFDTYIVEKGSFYKVQVGAFSVKSNADAMLNKLKKAGYSDAYITTEGGQASSSKPAKPSLKSVAEIAKEIYNGTCSDSRWSSWGTGSTRVERLKAAGYDVNAVQNEVNKLF